MKNHYINYKMDKKGKESKIGMRSKMIGRDKSLKSLKMMR